ncbi:MAG: WG repeat-containing protein [Clostridiaceae bacterium]|nr:WG repeat-containing protein [Clostridiaceae bacterium]
MKTKIFVIIMLFLLLVQAGCGKTGHESGTDTTGSRADTTDIQGNTAGKDNHVTGSRTEIKDSPETTIENSTPVAQTTPEAVHGNTQEKPYLYPVRNNEDKWGYINSEGEVVIDFIYDYAGFFADGTAVISLNGRYGVIDLEGNTVIKPQYDYIGYFSEGLARIVQYDTDTARHGFIDKDGNVFYKDYFNNNTGDFHDGLAVFEKDLNFGYVDKNGNIVIQPEYFMAYDFSEGLAAVANEDDKHGFIDKNGNLVIPFKFEHNLEGTYLYQGFSDGLAAVCMDGKFGYINTKGDFVIEPRYDYAERFSDGLALVIADGLYGYIDRSGNYVIEPKFAHASSFQNDFAFARMPGNTDYIETGGYALINKAGDFITGENLFYEQGGGYTFILEWSTGFVGELARVVMMVDNSPKFVYINKNGDIIWE